MLNFQYGMDFFAGREIEKKHIITITPTNCRVAILDFEPKVQKAGVQYFLQAFPSKRNIAHQKQCGLPFV